MCSATQLGFRRRRSKEETSESRVARSATGPGKPYWKRPAGSTGWRRFFDCIGIGTAAGTGAGSVVSVVDVAEIEVDVVAIACAFFSEPERVEYIAAVTPAPVAALTAAMIAKVVLDIVKVFREPLTI
jgi:hypothetical protein